MYKPRPKPWNRNPLNLQDPRIEFLSNKYNIVPKAIAYIRASMVSRRYTKQELISHIQHDNKTRQWAIEDHRVNPYLTEEKRIKLIEYTMNNIDFRVSVINILNRLTDDELHDILN